MVEDKPDLRLEELTTDFDLSPKKQPKEVKQNYNFPSIRELHRRGKRDLKGEIYSQYVRAEAIAQGI